MTVLSTVEYLSQEKAKEKAVEKKENAEKKEDKIAKKEAAKMEKALNKDNAPKTKKGNGKRRHLEFDLEYETRTFTMPLAIDAMEAMKVARGHLQGKADFIKSSIDHSDQVTRFVLPRLVASPERYKNSRQAKYLGKITLAQATARSALVALKSASLAIDMAMNIVCQAWYQGVFGDSFRSHAQLERMQDDMKKITTNNIRKVGGDLEMAMATSKLPDFDLYKIDGVYRTEYAQGIECAHGRFAFKLKSALKEVQRWAIDTDAKHFELDKDLWTSQRTWWKNGYEGNTDHQSALMVYRVLQLVNSASQCLIATDHVVHLAEIVRMGAMDCMQYEYGQLDNCPLPDAFNEYHVEKDHLESLRRAGEKAQKAWLQAAAVSNAAEKQTRTSTFCIDFLHTR